MGIGPLKRIREVEWFWRCPGRDGYVWEERYAEEMLFLVMR